MEAAVTIEQFSTLLHLEGEDGALLRVVRQLQSILDSVDTVSWPGESPTSLCWSGWA